MPLAAAAEYLGIPEKAIARLVAVGVIEQVPDRLNVLFAREELDRVRESAVVREWSKLIVRDPRAGWLLQAEPARSPVIPGDGEVCTGCGVPMREGRCNCTARHHARGDR
jgi:hypothetical protein